MKVTIGPNSSQEDVSGYESPSQSPACVFTSTPNQLSTTKNVMNGEIQLNVDCSLSKTESNQNDRFGFNMEDSKINNNTSSNRTSYNDYSEKRYSNLKVSVWHYMIYGNQPMVIIIFVSYIKLLCIKIITKCE